MVAASDVKDELAELERARLRLEAALASDEHWRALQAPMPGEKTATSEARKARDMRLEMALATNPTYRAWKHIVEAMEVLRERPLEADEEPVRAGEAASSPCDGEAGPGPEAVAEEEAVRVGPTADAAPPAADGAAPTMPEQPASTDAAVEVAEPVAAAASEQPHLSPDDSRPKALRLPPQGAEEATVTFVRKKPRQPLLPAATMPADLGTQRRSALFDRLRSVKEEEEPAKTAFAPPEDAEEADVVIVPRDSAAPQAEARAGRVRRFRKALSGD